MSPNKNTSLLFSVVAAVSFSCIKSSTTGIVEAFCLSPARTRTGIRTAQPLAHRPLTRHVNSVEGQKSKWNYEAKARGDYFEDRMGHESKKVIDRDNGFTTRRSIMPSLLFSAASVFTAATATALPEQQEDAFRSSAYGREEYTNSIIASRDTNISPKEVYDTIAAQLRYPLTMITDDKAQKRALDVGAGAGLSTQILWDLGYRSIDAIDWTREAWDTYVTSCPSTVAFYELDDERYIEQVHKNDDKFDVIAFNFGINESKAKEFTKLLSQPHGRLLAPVNSQTNYWLKQTYKAYDCYGNVLWSAVDVGAWSVQFQPDVTEETCQGVWCAPYNGFQKKKR